MDALEEKDIIYVAKLHWIIFVAPICMLILFMYLGAEYWQLREVSVFMIVSALLWSFMTWITYQFSSLTIKKTQVILRTGFLVRQTFDIPIGRIESIDIKQSVIGSIFQYGFLLITGTGGTRNSMNFIANPLTCRRYIEQLMNPPGVNS